jgi:macrodomain Ter protein organizer (MatP/YcbG family)
MPRAKYRITEADYQHASFYLSNKLRNYRLEFDGEVNLSELEDEFYEALTTKGAEQQVDSLNLWAEEYLSSEEWQKLKSAIRKRRQRRENYCGEKTVTISAKAHKILSQLAERDKVTYSDVLEHYLVKAVRSRRGTAKRRPR